MAITSEVDTDVYCDICGKWVICTNGSSAGHWSYDLLKGGEEGWDFHSGI